ncbi:hypothetical protein CLV58_1412 [Spirosoma oryzae]|uniref:Uncharacterized protein n=1 Tax=Spirosoma oryzae TaxID=1469603 RepID=A0A2T0RQP4_9BACT|nr:hypothetical protein [Spirosoma oryzae]PRY23481.1 hypothetical protein CLV58_1412 [Spirosoma oryzae]
MQFITKASIVQQALNKFGRVPRAAIPDKVDYIPHAGLYSAVYDDGSTLTFTDADLGRGVDRLEALDFVLVRTGTLIAPMTSYIYRRAIRSYVAGMPYGLIVLRDGSFCCVQSRIANLPGQN